MTRVACIMMQKDESLLLQPWIAYHAQLFGFENLYIYDNGSTMPDVLEILRRYEAVGVTVDRSHASPADFDNKGHVVGARLREFEQDGAYDIVFPMDCDEFVTIADRDGRLCTGGFSCGRTKIMAHLDALAAERSIVQVTHCLSNVPGALDLFRLTSFTKTFVPLGDFRSIDHGYHQASSHSGSTPRRTDIIYIHMHYKPFAEVIRHARDKLSAFVDTTDTEALLAYKGVGKHLVRYFTMDADSYANDLGGYPYPLVRYDGFARMLAAVMPVEPLRQAWCAQFVHPDNLPVVAFDGPFNAGDYLAANPDVARSIMNPTVHFCLFGFREGRAQRPPPPELSPDSYISDEVMTGHASDTIKAA